jgi:two-component system, OmpR family, sensor histidine kinase KdpD
MTMTTPNPGNNNLRFLWATPASAEATPGAPRDREPVKLKPADSVQEDNPPYVLDDEELLAATAHELRLPLSHIKGFVSTLRRSDVEWDESTRREFLAEIETETDRLTELVDKLLDPSSPHRTMAVSPVREQTLADPAALVRGGLHRVRGLLRDHTVRVQLPAWLPSVRVDADAIERVVANLLENAAKYSPPRTRIDVSAQLVDFGSLEIAVDDEGPGVPLEDRALIFEPFFRNQPDVPGHGLGLAICQAIVQAHGGDIRVGDSPGGGAHFAIRLPIELASRGSP